MGREIERKYLVDTPPPDLAGAPADDVVQGYLSAAGDATEVRVRRRGDARVLTVKRGEPPDREEVEIALDPAQFDGLWPLTAGARVEKTRHAVALGDGLVAEVDVYRGDLTGLVVVEVEFPSSQAAAAFTPPTWFGAEVTADPGYHNRQLAAEGRPPAQ